MKAGHVGKRCHKFQVQRVTQAKKRLATHYTSWCNVKVWIN